MERACLPALIALAAVGICATRSAQAQSLTLHNGDIVTVSGAGTVGTIDDIPVDNPNGTSYSAVEEPYYAVDTTGTSIFTLNSGGTLTVGQDDTALFAFGSGAVTVSGGKISSEFNGYGVFAGGSGPVNISGGTITVGNFGVAVVAAASGIVTVTGGVIKGDLDGGSLGSYALGKGLEVDSGSTLNLFSLGDSPFLINGVPMNNTSLGSYTTGRDTISGTLLNGDTLNVTFLNLGGTLNLNVGIPPAAAPEPSQFATLAIGILGLGALALRARKRTAA